MEDEEEKETTTTTMMRQMPRTLSHVIDVHHRARRKPNIARRHINIYTLGRAVLMQRSFFSLSLSSLSFSSPVIAVARFSRSLLSSSLVSLVHLLFLHLLLFFHLFSLLPFFFSRRATPRVIHCDGTSLPLVFRSALNKQAPIKVSGYIVHLEVGIISHGAHLRSTPVLSSALAPSLSSGSFSLCSCLSVCLFLSLFLSLPFDRNYVSKCSLISTRHAMLKTICHRRRKYAAERNVHSTCLHSREI